ncbi:MAG: glycosyltransferase family 4 protein, partial [Prolixibacteraceae bacterium]|nr:glycosyltransferase family 4 protein [Prolixibacteraceae bacterium]
KKLRPRSPQKKEIPLHGRKYTRIDQSNTINDVEPSTRNPHIDNNKLNSHTIKMKITWVTRSFLDYRIPIYREINRLCGNQLTVIYFKDVVPERCQLKLKEILGERAIALSGEIRIGGKKIENQAFANSSGIRIPLRPGLVKQVKKTKPDIILSDGFFQWTYAALLNNAMYGTPHLMLYERTLHTERNASRVRIFARKLAAKYISAIACNGIQTREYLIKFGFPKERLFMGNMAADTAGLQEALSKVNDRQKAELKEKYNLTGPVLLYVGQIIPRKGIMQLLDAWKDVEKKYPQPQLVLIGDGEQLEDAKKYLKKNNINNVRLPGKVDYSEVAQFYALADLFIIPTLEDNWSLVVPEAMSCGLPVICSKYNGCWPELVQPQNGWVFDPLNPENFKQILQSAWEKQEKWPAMGKESLRIVQDYTPEKVAQKIFIACQSTLNK